MTEQTEAKIEKEGAPASAEGQKKPGAVIFVAAFAAFVATFNETFLNVAFTPIMADFGVDVSTVQWLAAAYMLGAAVMVPVSAFAYRSIPTKPLFLVTVGLLVAGSIIGGFAANFPILLVGRIVQALGTGMLIPIGMNITLEAAPKRKLGTYMGIMGAMTTLGPSSSVIAAGVLLAFFDWHMLLWVFAGLSFLCFLCGLFLLSNVAHLTHPRLDVLSVILIGLALIGILYGISTVFSGSILIAVIAAVLGVLLLMVFVSRQKKLKEPLINLKPLSVGPFSIGVMSNMLSLIIIFAMNIVMPLFMQNVLGVSALQASLTLFPAILLSCVISPIAGKIYDQHGPGVLLPLGFALLCIFSLGLIFGKGTGSLVLMAILYIPVICGSALIIGPVQSFALSRLKPELNPHGVTVMSTGFQIAGCIGSSLFSGVYSMTSAGGKDGFIAAGVLAAALAAVGFVLGLIIRKQSKTAKVEHPSSGHLEGTGIAAAMKQDAYCVSVHDTLLDALRCMTDKKTGGLPIVDESGSVAGFISDGDIVRFMLDSDVEGATFASMYPLWHNASALDEQLDRLAKTNVMELANRKVVVIDFADDIRSLFKALSDKRIKKVPVLKDGKMIGTASRSDLLRELVKQSSYLQEERA